MAPAMNPEMWSHPATREASQSWALGVRFIPVEQGRTACGEVGVGRLAEPADIVAAIEAALPGPPAAGPGHKRGTAEPIDGVRVITNQARG